MAAALDFLRCRAGAGTRISYLDTIREQMLEAGDHVRTAARCSLRGVRAPRM